MNSSADSVVSSENAPASTTPPERRPSVAPTWQLSRAGMLASFGVMVGIALLTYAFFPASVGGPPLPVSVKLEKQPVPTRTGQMAVMTDVVVLENLAEHSIQRVDLELNGQYLFFQQQPLQPGERLVLPLRVFTDKRSSQRLDPARYPITEVMVRGQLPSGARGVSKFEVGEHQE